MRVEANSTDVWLVPSTALAPTPRFRLLRRFPCMMRAFPAPAFVRLQDIFWLGGRACNFLHANQCEHSSRRARIFLRFMTERWEGYLNSPTFPAC